MIYFQAYAFLLATMKIYQNHIHIRFCPKSLLSSIQLYSHHEKAQMSFSTFEHQVGPPNLLEVKLRLQKAWGLFTESAGKLICSSLWLTVGCFISAWKIFTLHKYVPCKIRGIII